MKNIKRIISAVLTLVMVIGMTNISAFAADVSVLRLAPQAKVVVDGTEDKTVSVMFTTEEAINIALLQGAFSVKEVENTSYLKLSDYVVPFTEDTNNNFTLADGSFVYCDEANYVGYGVSANGNIVTAVYTVDKNTPAGNYTVALNLECIDGDVSADAVEYTAIIEVSEPVDTSNPKFTVYYEIAGADTDNDNFKEIEPGTDVAVDVYVKADSEQVMQAFDIYPEWDTAVLTYKSIAAATGFKIVDEMDAADPHFQTDLISSAVSTDQTVGTDGVKVATMTFAFSENAVYDTEYSVWLDAETNLAKQKDAESVKNVTVTAEDEMGVETLNQYDVTYDANGGEGTPEAQVKKHNIELTLSSTVPTLAGHTFKGWTNVENPALDAAVEYTAGGTYTANEGVTLYAVWKLATAEYKVVHKQQNLDGSAYVEKETETLSGNTGAETAAVAKPYEGFTAQTITQGTIAADGSTVVVILYDRNSYELTWNDGTNKNTTAVKYGATITKPANPSKTGYTFGGWDEGIPDTMPAEDLTFNAVWNANTVTVTLNANGGKIGDAETKEITVTYDGKYTTLTDAPTKDGYAFAGWFTQQTGGTEVTADTAVTNANNHPLYAHWTANTYTVKFHAGTGAGSMEDQSFTYDAEAKALSANEFTAPSENHVFAGWDTNEAATTAVYTDKQAVKNLTAEANGVIDLYAVWKQNVYTITYNNDPESVTTTTNLPATYSTDAKLEIPNPEATGYTFAGWTSTALNITTATKDLAYEAGTITGNIDLTAHWTINEYTITFDTNGGSEIEAITKNYGEAITAPADPTKTGYTFASWDKQIPATMPAEDMTITANWTINQYTITFVDDDGTTELGKITQDYETAVTAPANPTKTGYTFANWDVEIPATMPAEDVTITAIWTENTYDITYDDSDDDVEYADTVENQENVKYTEEVTLPTKDEVTKPGYELTGWTTVQNPGDEDTVYTPGGKVSGLTPENNGAVMLYPVWTEATYELSFNLGEHPETDATVPGAVEVTYNAAYPELPTVSPDTGYEFMGWYINVEDENTKIEQGATVAITEDTVLTAKYKATEYTITFELNGGKDLGDAYPGNQMAYTIESTDALPTPTRDGLYTFAGWKVKETVGSWVVDALHGPATTNLNKAHGNVTLVAQWTESFTYEIEEYKYAPTDYVMLRIATGANTNGYSFDGIDMLYTDDSNYKIGEQTVFVTLIPTEGNVADGKLTPAAMEKIVPTNKEGTVIVRDGKINKDDVINIADANAVYQMIVNGGGYYTLEQLDIQARLEADMSTATTAGDYRGTITDVNAIVNLINGN